MMHRLSSPISALCYGVLLVAERVLAVLRKSFRSLFHVPLVDFASVDLTQSTDIRELRVWQRATVCIYRFCGVPYKGRTVQQGWSRAAGSCKWCPQAIVDVLVVNQFRIRCDLFSGIHR